MATDTLEIFGDEFTGVTGIKATDDNGQTKVYIRPQGTKSISANGTGIDVTDYASVDVSVSGGGGVDMPTLTVTWDNNMETILSVSCDKTFSECETYCNDGVYYCVVIQKTQDESWSGQNIATWYDQATGTSADYIVWTSMNGTFPEFDIRYNYNNTFATTVPSVQQITMNITTNGTYYPSGGVVQEVNVSVPSSSPTLQSKTATPTESQQTISPDSGYDGLSSVTVGAVSSTYVGSGIARRTASDLYGEYDYGEYSVNVPSGYYDANYYKAVPNGSAATPATTITANPSISINSTGLITATASASQSVTPTVSAGYVRTGTAGTITVSGSNTGQLTTQAAQTIHPSTSDQTIASGRYLTGAQTIKAVTLSNLTAANIKSGVTVTVGDSTDSDCVASVTGTYSGGSSKNVQAYIGYASRTANSYGATSVTLTVAKTGTYTISWCAWRGSSSGTMGTNLHIGSTAESANHQTWTGTYGQCITLTNQSLTQGTVLTLYATSGNNSRTIYVGNLIIEEG